MTQEQVHLLVVDDEETTRSSLADILRLEGYHVQEAGGGAEAIQMISDQIFDLILLDLKMPGIDGLDVINFIAQINSDTYPLIANQLTPVVIMLTAHGSLESAIEALRRGAHDYLLKPSSSTQILNSVTKGLRARADKIQQYTRLKELEQAQLHADNKNVRSRTAKIYQLPNNITYDPARREITCNTELIQLTPTENKLIKVLLDNPGHVFTHRELVLLVQGYDTKDWEAPEVLRPLVSRLRRKLALLPGGNTWITSIRGTGYVFEVQTMT